MLPSFVDEIHSLEIMHLTEHLHSLLNYFCYFTDVTCLLQYKLKRCSNKECCKQCRYVMFKGTVTKLPVQKLTQGTTQKLLQHHDATDI